MQVVIDIDENVFTRLFDNGTEDYEIANDDLFAIAKAIRKGTPLPKGHGKIGDLDRLYNVFKKNVVRADAFKELFDIAPTIIEADKEGEEV